ncbi:hypothetical protein I7I50_10283 [Histoplasma capsulatum G186AR]|uniref:Uncharacterized protein n=1 Tax=Ajellomyces capsulatus TaxID=5037 RepID=A0A8H7Z6H5_AJECA|nr:hypothetical protein I7I52_01522 [Histoplasma capsulatum]QSS69103.1 hypothetical protein I7I50_10283 [Histoplasma capsulatum G186AR]
MDVEHLIALLTEVAPQNELPRQADIRLEDTFHERLRIVLDAIASVLVSKPRGEVIAVGMRSQQNGLGKKIILTLASNTGIPKKTYQHARNLIDDLKKLGADFADYRKSAEQEIHTSQQSEPGRVDSPEIDERNLPPHLRQKIYFFRRRVLLFALPKIHQRLHKGYKPTKSSRGLTFVRIAEELDININSSVNILKKCSMIINWMLHHLPNNSRLFSIEKEDYVVEGLNSIAGMVDELFETKTWLADIPNTSSKTDDFPFEQFLRKMSSISSNTDTLLQYAYSPRLYQKYLINTDIEVECLNRSQRPIQLPSPDKWRQIAEEILKAQGASSLLRDISETNKNIPGLHLQKSFKRRKTVKGWVHCECMLVLYLIGNSRLGISALPYIGVSKLSCVACWEFFNALHKVDCMFYVKGSHSKAYFPWKFPDVEMNSAKLLKSEKEKILKSFYSDLAATYTQRFNAKERLRRMSESSTGSTKPIARDRWPAEKFRM